jgi:molecular chaperone GrpE
LKESRLREEPALARRVPIENADDENREHGGEGEEPSVGPSQDKVRKAYLADEPPVLPEQAAEVETVEGEVEDEEGSEMQLLRLAAEFDNYKKRMERERSLARAYANEGLLERLLPVVDNLERALAAAGGGAAEGLVEGVELTLRELLEVLRREGVEPIDAEGLAFDPTVHEAVLTQPSDDLPEGSVISQVEKGYQYKDRILRPAKVVVSSGPP